jgi:mycothiol synthase
MSELRWSAPSRADDPAWVALLAAIEEVDERGETYEVADLGDEWDSVWSHPDTDATFVWDGPDLVAFAWLKAMPGQRQHHRVGFWGGVRPSHRRRGIGTALFEWSVQRGREIAETFGTDLPTELDIDADARQQDLVTVAANAGLEPVRTFLELARPTADAVLPVPAPAGLELVPWSAELDEDARLAHTEAFADHWGSEPRSAEEWAQWYTGHRNFRPDLSVLAVDPASGQVAALVLTAAYPQDWERLPREAWINTVGTRRAWRGKGVARWLMGDVHRRIADSDTGFERAILGVDSENPTGALGLYRGLGYETVRSVLSLARPLG